MIPNIMHKQGLRGQRHRRVMVAVLTACPILAAGCAQSKSPARSGGSADVRGTQIIRHEDVVLAPSVEAGLAGWCLGTEPGACPAATLRRGPIVAEAQSTEGQSTPPERSQRSASSVERAVILTTGAATAVSINGGPAVPTQEEAGLPAHLRAVVVEIQNAPRTYQPEFKAFLPGRLRVVPLNPQGTPLRQTAQSAGSMAIALPGRQWLGPARAPRSECEIHSGSVRGLVARSGFVVSTVKPMTGLPARPMVACATTYYAFDGTPLLASILVDGEHPGSEPARLPAMQPLAEHPGIFQAIGGAMQMINAKGRILAQRIRGGWVVVGNGRDDRQRLTLLAHLRAIVQIKPAD